MLRLAGGTGAGSTLLSSQMVVLVLQAKRERSVNRLSALADVLLPLGGS